MAKVILDYSKLYNSFKKEQESSKTGRYYRLLNKEGFGFPIIYDSNKILEESGRYIYQDDINLYKILRGNPAVIHSSYFLNLASDTFLRNEFEDRDFSVFKETLLKRLKKRIKVLSLKRISILSGVFVFLLFLLLWSFSNFGLVRFLNGNYILYSILIAPLFGFGALFTLYFFLEDFDRESEFDFKPTQSFESLLKPFYVLDKAIESKYRDLKNEKLDLYKKNDIATIHYIHKTILSDLK